ncbi:MAG: hypothetical protein ACJ790_05360 [Myxococcaceae bacterium]
MNDVVLRVREALILFAFKIARLQKERGPEWVPTDDEKTVLLGEACAEVQLSEEHLAEALGAVPELAEWYARAMSHTET